MKAFIVWSTVLQVAMVTGGHYNATVLGLSAILGVGIPLALGLVYGLTREVGPKTGAKDAFVFGLVGAFLGVVLAILLGDAAWTLLTFAPLSSGVTGAIGGAVGGAMGGSPAEA